MCKVVRNTPKVGIGKHLLFIPPPPARREYTRHATRVRSRVALVQVELGEKHSMTPTCIFLVPNWEL